MEITHISDISKFFRDDVNLNVYGNDSGYFISGQINKVNINTRQFFIEIFQPTKIYFYRKTKNIYIESQTGTVSTLYNRLMDIKVITSDGKNIMTVQLTFKGVHGDTEFMYFMIGR